jgi:thymidine kinase
MPQLDIIFGPMFAGKSTELIRRIRQLKTLDKKYIVIKHYIDNRYSKNHIVSHNNDKETCIKFNTIKQVYNYLINDNNYKSIDTLFIDEAQFFEDLKKYVLLILEQLKLNIIIVGLDGDFNREKFGEILDLIPYCDSCKKINALCKECNDGTPAIFTHRKNHNNKQIEIGNNYISLCRYHYLKYNN